MPNAAVRTDEATAEALRTHRLGAVNVTTHPHHIENIGPRLFLVLQEHSAAYRLNLVPGDARFIAYCLGIAVAIGDAIQQNRTPPTGAIKQLTQKHTIGTATFAISVGDMPEGFRIVLLIEEYGMRYELPLSMANAQLLRVCLTSGACEADALERTARQQSGQRAVTTTTH